MSLSTLAESLDRATALESDSNWEEAASLYKTLLSEHPRSHPVLLGLCRSYHHLSKYQESIEYGRRCLEIEPECWRTWHTIALSMRKTGGMLEALKILARLSHKHPDIDPIRLDYADFVVRVMGDWALAESILNNIKDPVAYKDRLNGIQIRKVLYRGTGLRSMLTLQQKRYADAELSLGNLTPMRRIAPIRTRKRIGLVSILFRASPVYHLCYGALAAIARDHDLVFFSRDKLGDWATTNLKEIAAEWHQVGHLDAIGLSVFLSKHDLDALVDLSGVLDREGLRAFSNRPVARQYKWVGGQAMTTGMSAFDGYLSDRWQSPNGTEVLYTEPLLLLESGYVTYTPPPYLPAPTLRQRRTDSYNVGVISNPIKLSPAFLKYLFGEIRAFNQDHKVRLQFIGWRYGLPAVQRRVLLHLGQEFEKHKSWLTIAFVPSINHADFLVKVSKLDWVIDTFPYTSGVTALECLAMDVPIRTRAGELFAERHAYSHCRYAGLEEHHFDLDQLGAFNAPPLDSVTSVLLPEHAARCNHEQLGQELAEVLVG